MVVLVSIVILVVYYYFQDREREPLLKLVEVFVLGVVMVFQVNFVQDKLLQFSISYIYQSFIVAATVEELIKYATIRLTIYRDKEFDSWMDGVVYCVTLGLGFGLIESFILNDNSINRAITAIPLHSLVAVVMGYYLGAYKMRREKADLIATIVFPILLHGIYNYIVYINNVFLFAVYFVGLWIISTYLVSKIRKENDDVKLG